MQWKQLFLSDDAVAILHDAFWWTFIDQFEVISTYFFAIDWKSVLYCHNDIPF